MIKKLRIKLVTVAMLSLLFVLFVIESIVGVLNYGKIIKDADRILNILGENSGSFPKKGLSDKMENKHFMSPEIPYESRYFSVLLSNDGTVVLADTGRVAYCSMLRRPLCMQKMSGKINQKEDLLIITDI